jgi:hypothetical protein
MSELRMSVGAGATALVAVLTANIAGCFVSEEYCAATQITNKTATSIVIEDLENDQLGGPLLPNTSGVWYSQGCWTAAARPIRLRISTPDGSSSFEYGVPLDGGTTFIDIVDDGAGGLTFRDTRPSE